MATGAVAAAGLLIVPAMIHLAAVSTAVLPALAQLRNQRAVLLRLPNEVAPERPSRVIRMEDMWTARLVPAEDEGVLAVQLSGRGPRRRVEEHGTVRWLPPPPLRLEGQEVDRVLARTLARANYAGARLPAVDRALGRLAAAPDREHFLRQVAQRGGGFFRQTSANTVSDPAALRGAWSRLVGTFRGERIAGGTVPLPPPQIPTPERLALEMALHEESERRALEGELAELKAAWREAEEIAAIADVLPDDPLDRLEKS